MTTPVETVIDWKILRSQLHELNRYAMEDLTAVFQTGMQLDPEHARDYIEDAMYELAYTYGAAAGDLTADWWNEYQLDDVMKMPPGYTPNMRQLTSRVRWGTVPLITKTGDPLGRLAGILQQVVFGAQRDKVQEQTMLSRTGYARLASPDACPFCRVLASRGAVYRSMTSAKYVGMSAIRPVYDSAGNRTGERMQPGRVRGPRQRGEKFHDHCRCMIVPKQTAKAKLELPDYYDQFEDEYYAAKAALHGRPLTMSNITKIMREQLKETGTPFH